MFGVPIDSPAKRGQPRASALDLLRTQVWYFAVEQALGLPSAYAVEMKLEGHKVAARPGNHKPSKWANYRDGKHVPRRAQIELAERAAPGTARWFDSPMWDVLSGKTDPKFSTTKYFLQNQSIKNELFSKIPLGDCGEISLKLDKFSNIKNLDEIDLLESAILSMQYAFDLRSPSTLKVVLCAYIESSRKISFVPQLSECYEDFLDAIEARFIPLPEYEEYDGRPWGVRMPDRSARRDEAYLAKFGRSQG